MFSQDESKRRSRSLGYAGAVLLLVAVLLVPAFASVLGPLSSDASILRPVVGIESLAQDELPVANASIDQNVFVGASVTLNGSASTGFEGPSNLNYTWNVTYRNFTSGAKFAPFARLYGMMPHFTANRTGIYLANLTVRDSKNNVSWDDVNVVAREKPKTWLEQNLLLVILGAFMVAILLYVLAFSLNRIRKGEPVISQAGREKAILARKRLMKVTKQLLKNPMGVIGVIILAVFMFIAAFGPSLAPYDTSLLHPNDKLQLPSKSHVIGINNTTGEAIMSQGHLMGTDNFGKDIWSELLVGARTSMIVGVVSAIIASFLGAAVGLYSGYVGGWKDEVVMRLNDIVLSIPWLVLMIVIAALLGQIDLTGIILIIGLTGWSTTARMVRAQVLSVRERQYIERARCVGSSDLAIIRRHIFPNTFPLVFANTILTVAVSILSEATLSFLGFRPLGVITWGTMLSFASSASAFQIGMYWWILAPGFCIVLVVLGFTLLGYALDEILNPKLRHR
jgi:peptide/nickel transport system permease protein